MKKAILTLAVTVFIAATTLTICQSAAIKDVNTQDKVALIKREFYQSLKDSLLQFNKESEEKISKYEMNIVEYKTRIANEKKEKIVRYQKKMAELDQ